VHQVEIHIVDAEGFEGGFDTLVDALVPWIVELGGDPYLVTGNTGVFDALADFFFVAVGERGVDVSVAF